MFFLTGCFLRGVAAASRVATWTLKTVLRPVVASPINQFGASLAVFHTSDADYSSSPFLCAAYVVAVGAPGDVAPSSTTTSVTSNTNTNKNKNVFAGSVYLFLGPHNFTSASTNAVVASDKWAFMSKVRYLQERKHRLSIRFYFFFPFNFCRCLPTTAALTMPMARA